MRIESLYIQSVRNIPSLSLTFSSGLHQFVGGNGEGKTAILEALNLLIVGTSFRTHQLKEIVKEGEKNFFIEALYEKNGVRSRLSLGYDGARRYVMINGEPQSSSSLLFGNILGVATTPLDYELIYGSPSERRRFIDEQIAQVDSQYIAEMRRLQRSLAQRNALLKQRDFKTIQAWEEQIARSSVYINRARYQAIKELSPYFQEMTKTLLGKSSLHGCELAYQSTLFHLDDFIGENAQPLDDALIERALKTFHDKRDNEAKAGTTLYGPQRDDIAITWNQGKAVKTQASLGQAKVISLGLRLSEWQLLHERSHGVQPIFMIDDLHSFLDEERVSLILSSTQKLGQIFVTSHMPCHVLSHGMVYRIEDAKVQSSYSVFTPPQDLL